MLTLVRCNTWATCTRKQKVQRFENLNFGAVEQRRLTLTLPVAIGCAVPFKRCNRLARETSARHIPVIDRIKQKAANFQAQ